MVAIQSNQGRDPEKDGYEASMIMSFALGAIVASCFIFAGHYGYGKMVVSASVTDETPRAVGDPGRKPMGTFCRTTKEGYLSCEPLRPIIKHHTARRRPVPSCSKIEPICLEHGGNPVLTVRRPEADKTIALPTLGGTVLNGQ